MRSIKTVNLLIVLQVFCLTLVIGLNCTNQCCYYYHGVPKNVTTMSCNPEGSTITWECQVYSPRDSGTNLSVKWYRSASAVSAREEGELIPKKRGKYTFTALPASSAVNDSQSVVNGLFLDVFRLAISNFDSNTDDGYYWCQMIINDTTCLQPSDVGRITTISLLTRTCNFSPLDFIEFEMPQVCARRSQCTTEPITTEARPITSTQGKNTNTFSSTTSAANNSTFESSMTIVILYAIIGVLVFIIIVLLLVVMVFTIHTVKNHRVFEIKQAELSHELDVKDSRPPLQSVNVFNQFTQTDDSMASTEVTQRSETPREQAEPLSNGHPPQPVAAVPPPSSSPPQPPTSVSPPTDKPPQLTSDNPISLSRSSLKGDDVTYAYPMQRQLLKSREATKSSPALTAGQYQDIRVSRLDYVPMYNFATNAKRTNTEAKDDLDSKMKPSYVNLAS